MMQKGIVATIMGLVLVLIPTVVFSQSMGTKHHGMMDEPAPGQMGVTTGKQGSPQMPYPGLMGDCGGMGGPMMGYSMGSGMMHGSGMGYLNHPMMGSNVMGMHGMGMYGNTDWSSEKMRTFLDETRDLRKQIHDLRFEYGEKMRNPKTTMGELQKMQEQLSDLQKQLLEKYPN